MRTFSLSHIASLRKNARAAYHQACFEQEFDVFWDKSVVYRMDAPIPFAGYWDSVREIKLRAWEDEALAHAEGK